METKFRKGPWHAEHDDDLPCVMAADPARGTTDCIATVNPFEADYKETLAAITALPDLYEALEPFGDVDGEGDEDFPDNTKVVVTFGRTTFHALTLGDFRRARAALLKATGGEA